MRSPLPRYQFDKRLLKTVGCIMTIVSQNPDHQPPDRIPVVTQQHVKFVGLRSSHEAFSLVIGRSREENITAIGRRLDGFSPSLPLLVTSFLVDGWANGRRPAGIVNIGILFAVKFLLRTSLPFWSGGDVSCD